MKTNIVNTTPFHLTGSPRYHTVKNEETVLIPADYLYQDRINGTYDKFFPCYSLDTSDVPTIELTIGLGTPKPLKGDLGTTLFRDQFKGKEVGKKEAFSSPVNSNLEYKKVFYAEHWYTKLTPGWCVIQTAKDVQGKETPAYLVRALGNDQVCRSIHAIDLPSSKQASPLGSFLPGMIVKYEESVWKCLKKTRSYPPRKPSKRPSVFWELVEFASNVFNADVFSMSESGSSYFTEVTDPVRTFNPKTQDDSLVLFNVAYHHS
ncbi:hypothetical protein [Chroococcidiopsis sp.]|uniref:hypothetical protein n=1 Tax=Chroococcidiopsis sp. TaxID=3088168 RepID=UPI003F3FB929